MGSVDFSYSVTRLVNSLIEHELKLEEKYKRHKSSENGKYYHKILGFENEKIYENVIMYDGYTIRIYGSPDRVDREKKVVEELKTYRFKENLDFQKRKGKYQLAIYCYLVGYSDAILYVYNVVREVFEYTTYLYIPREDQVRIIESALNILLKNKLSKKT
ncbi:MAG: PD-(D/E)XK nuclease family protein [Candidatus Aenigmatarchaeota archaeon]